MKHLFLVACSLLLLAVSATAQNYHAMEGSPYAGALGGQNNPAAIVGVPYKWDFVLLGLQLSNSTNAFSIHDYAYLSSPVGSLYHIDDGMYARKASLNLNLNLLNTRIALNRKSSIGFGVNLRSYTNLLTSEYDYNDTLHNTTEFFKINQGINSINGKILSSSWMEAYISYARTLSDNTFGRLNAGLTVRVNRGLSGAYVNADHVSFSQTLQNNRPVYSISSANTLYGYSANYDHWQSSDGTGQNIKNLFNNAEGGASFDAGIEYLIKPQGTISFNDEPDYYDYDWKIGLALLDIGGNQYKYGTQSRVINGVKQNISGQVIDGTFDSTITTVRQFNDSLAMLVDASQVNGKFTILNPMRLVLNIDHYVTGNFYINAGLSVNVPLSSINKTYLQVKEINLLSLTPRWETKRFGFYLPMQYNTQNQFWVGGAVKAGPLLLGVHNLANLFGKTSTQNGGGYLALVFRAPGSSAGKTDKRLNCPIPVW